MYWTSRSAERNDTPKWRAKSGSHPTIAPWIVGSVGVAGLVLAGSDRRAVQRKATNDARCGVYMVNLDLAGMRLTRSNARADRDGWSSSSTSSAST